MAQQFPPKFHKALAAEVSSWQEENLITKDVADVLLARYPVKGTQGAIITIMTILGSVLVGLGALLFIGANWYQLGPVCKLAMIFTAIVAAHAAGWYFRFEPGNRPKLGTALLLLGSLFYGAGIWLVAQIFNLESNFSDGLLLWALGTALSACVTKVSALGVLANVLGSAWLLSNNPSSAYSPLGSDMLRFAVVTAFSMVISYMTRSPWSMAFGLIGSAMWVGLQSGTERFGLLAWGATLYGGYLWHKRSWQLFEKPFMYVGVTSTLLALLCLTFNDHGTFLSSVQLDRLAMLVCVALGGLAAPSLGEKKTPPEVAAAFVVTMAAYLIACIPSETGRMLLYNANVLAALVLLAVAGLRRLHSIALVNLTVVFFVFFIIARYFDMFFSMLDRSVFFVMGGIVLLAAGSFAERSRRKLIEGFQT